MQFFIIFLLLFYYQVRMGIKLCCEKLAFELKFWKWNSRNKFKFLLF